MEKASGIVQHKLREGSNGLGAKSERKWLGRDALTSWDWLSQHLLTFQPHPCPLGSPDA